MRSSRSSSRTMIGGENARIDVAAAQDQPDLAAAESLRLDQHGGEPGGARAFGHGLLQREIGIDGALEMRLVDQHDLGHELAHDRQRQRADILDRDALGQRRRRRAAGARRAARSRTTDRAPPRRRRSRSRGRRARAAMALPAISPPPPIGITSMSRSGTSSSISSAMVPCPAITSGSS